MMWSPLHVISAIVQIVALSCVFYYIFLLFRGTRGAQILLGLVLFLVLLMGLTQVFNLDVVNWVLRRVSVFLGAALLIIFQPEIRRALAELGRQPVSFTVSEQRRPAVDAIVRAVAMLAEQRVGALIAVEREIGTGSIQDTGTKLDARVEPELLASIFFPHTPLHDGGVIIRDSRIVAAGCIFPLSQQTDLHKQLGMRHRAAMGLSEETDAVVVVVSEETGGISVCYRGRLSRGLDEDRLRRFLVALLLKEQAEESRWRRARKHLRVTPDSLAGPAEGAARGDDHAI